MSKSSSRADARAETPIERLQHWVAVLASALLHLLFLILALWSSPVTMSSTQGTAGGSRMAVEFIGATPPQPTPPTPTRPARKPAAKPAAARVQSTAVTRADEPIPPVNLADAGDATQDQAPAATPPPPTPPQRRSRAWGQPPGMLQENLAPENAGPARSTSIGRGRGNDAGAAGPSMEVGGYQVYYDLISENRLRAWRDQGMTELFLPLPGTRRYMICPLETALRRESGPCRMLEPDSPELANIGDARQAIDMERVYRQGELVWRGPGPYK